MTGSEERTSPLGLRGKTIDELRLLVSRHTGVTQKDLRSWSKSQLIYQLSQVGS